MSDPSNQTVQILPANGAEAVEAVRSLLREYWDSFGFTPCFQNFGEELAGLPGAYAPPGGRLALALVGDRPAGCVALRRVDANRAEPKRLYVRPGFRGLGLGRTLLEWAMSQARAAGYTELVGDTMPVMKEALALYDRMGFERVGRGAPVQASQFPEGSEEPILIRKKL
jgi:GNAT superfamily N-acetyltransferase